MTPLRFSAPGKVVLSGEYAVLRGAPAVAMAVDRRAIVTIEPGDFEVQCIGLEGRTDTRLVECVLDALDRAPPKGRLILDTAAFSDGPHKLGIGSSAALAVALTTALAAEGSDALSIENAAHSAHRAFQGGSGSGVDVAASSVGGIIVYNMQQSSTQAIGWPEGLHYSLFWTGVSASTSERVARFDAAADSAAADALGIAASDVADAWRSGRADDVLAQYAPYIEALRALSREYGLGIFDGGHEVLMRAEPGLIYKPCGAGGGDVGIALSNDPGQLEDFTAQAATSGCRRLEVALDTRGVEKDAARG